MNEINSLNHFFSEIDCHFQCYNLARKIFPIDQQVFIDFESTHAAWSTPFLQHAWIGLIFWQKQSGKNNHNAEHHVWFLKLPLDEQAKLNLAARDDFLRRLFEALGDFLINAREQKQSGSTKKRQSLEGAMQDNPYGFQPKPEQLANFHAIVHKQLSLPASSYYRDTQDYLLGNSPHGKKDFNHWDKLGFQGFADIAARLNEICYASKSKTNEQVINEAIEHLPIEPFQVLSTCLENHSVSKKTTEIIYKNLMANLSKKNQTPYLVQLCVSSIQASSQSTDQALQIKLLSKILNSDIQSDIEILAILSGRCWPLISHQEILPAFLEALAASDNEHPGAFKAILSDLMFIPGMRDTILQAFRSPERSQQLAHAIGAFFSSI